MIQLTLHDSRAGHFAYFRQSGLYENLDHLRTVPVRRVTVWDKSYSSEILSTPPERRWWSLAGEATFRQANKEVKKQIYLIAYRDQGNWYFTPLPIDNATAVSHFGPEQLAANLEDQARVVLRVPNDSPLRIVDVHVFTDPSNVLSRKVTFRLRNITGKRVTGYTYRISDSTDDGDEIAGLGDQKDWIEPWAESHEFREDDVTAYYWCEGQGDVKNIIEIQDVRFQDGRGWTAPQEAGSNKHP